MLVVTKESAMTEQIQPNILKPEDTRENFEATLLRATVEDHLHKELPVELTDEALVALYHYATWNKQIVNPGNVHIDTNELQNVIRWLSTYPQAYVVLQEIIDTYGDKAGGYMYDFENRLEKRAKAQ